MLELINRAHIALTTRLEREDGQAMVEYALILALVSVVAIGTLKLVGTDVNSVFLNIKSKLDAAL
jgi:pilus assembly protein Flp/PilA